MEIIIKPTEACNGTCVYCSADGSLGKRKILPREQLGRLFESFAAWLRSGERRNLRFLWHGGEPMLCGPDYYLEVIQQQQRVFGPDIERVRNAMQSNLSLVDEQWAPVLRTLLKDQAIGTSFDIVDGVRGLAGGKDLREVWVRSVNLLRRNGIRVGAVYVAHRGSLARARDIYRFFQNMRLHLRVNPLYREGRADDAQSKPLWITAEEYGQFLVDLCEIWRADRMRWSIMPLTEWYRAWQGDSRLCCDSRGMCHTSHLGINPDGAVFGCGRQSDHRDNNLGNIFEDDLGEILLRREQGALSGRSPGLREGYCRDCRFWELCHGGCPMMGLLYHGDMMRETYFCAARKRLFEHFEAVFGEKQSAVSDQRSARGEAVVALTHPSAISLPPLLLNPEPRTSPQASRRGDLNPMGGPPAAPRCAVTIERPEAWPMTDFVRIVTAQPDLERLVLGRLDPRERGRAFVSEGRFAAAPAEYAPFAGKLIVVAGNSQGPPQGAFLDAARRLRAELMFSPATIGDGWRARQAADANVPVPLDFGTDYAESVLSALLDHFLHTPTLQVPMEPFYSLAETVGQSRRLTLWQIFDSEPGRCLFVDARGRVSLSRWWASRGLFLGKLGDSPKMLKNSALHKQLDAYQEQVFISQTPCAFCTHFSYCRGIWRAASDADSACQVWQRLMDRMVEAYQALFGKRVIWMQLAVFAQLPCVFNVSAGLMPRRGTGM